MGLSGTFLFFLNIPFLSKTEKKEKKKRKKGKQIKPKENKK